MKKRAKTTMIIEYDVNDDGSITKEKRERGLAHWAKLSARLMFPDSDDDGKNLSVEATSELLDVVVKLPILNDECQFLACDDNGEWHFFDRKPDWDDNDGEWILGNYRDANYWKCQLFISLDYEPGKNALLERVTGTKWEWVS